MHWKLQREIVGTAFVAVTLAVMVSGCREAEPEADQPVAKAAAAVIVAPVAGETVSGPSVRVELAVENIALRPAGVDESDSGHLHLFIDRDLTPAGEVIPSEDGIVHLGKAQTEHLLEALAPGEHTVIAVLGDYLHIRIADARTDTVRFSVRG
jgi:hypothetical protein